MFPDFIDEFRHASPGLLAQPGCTAAVVLTLALGYPAQSLLFEVSAFEPRVALAAVPVLTTVMVLRYE